MGVIETFVATYATEIALGATALSAAGSYMQAKQQEKAQEAYNDAVVQDTIRKYGELDAIEKAAIDEEHRSSLAAQRDNLKARSDTILASSVTGTYGGSVDQAINNLNAGLANNLSEVVSARESQLDNINRQARSLKAGGEMSMDKSIKMPAFYQAFASGLNTYNSVSNITGRVKKAYDEVKKPGEE